MKSKGVELLILGLLPILRKNNNVKILIVGDGPCRKSIVELVNKLNIQERVVFTGTLDNVYISLQASTIYAHITFQDAFPLTVLEAMVSKVPIVASKIGGIPEVIDHMHNGILVKNNEIAIRKAILSILKNSRLKKRLIEEAYKKVNSEYSWKITASKYLEIYKE